jgi:hypothetical protein
MDRETVDEIKRHFDVVAEGLESKIQAVAEGVGLANERIDSLGQQIDGLDRRMDGLDQRMDGLEQEMRAGFAELRATVKVSHAETDRRLTALESR